MSRLAATRIGFFLYGAGVGAAIDGVAWTFWAAWAVAWTSFGLLAYWHRPRNGAHA